MKPINIPVRSKGAGGHIMPYFQSEGLYLSHGDDPYSQDAVAAPVGLLLIDKRQYDAWFPADNPVFAESNVGRRTSQLALQYPGAPWILTRYCDDMKAGRGHAASRVYTETFDHYFTLPKWRLRVCGRSYRAWPSVPTEPACDIYSVAGL